MDMIATLVAFAFILLIGGIALHAAFRIRADKTGDPKKHPSAG
jgi:hypothetical protein